jgi:hypothetical protein
VNEAVDYSFDGSNPILPSQYNYLIRRRSFALAGEYRLLWAVLESEIEGYLANQTCATAKQREAFEEVYDWFHAPPDQGRGLFAFPTICDLLEIDSWMLLKGLDSIRDNGLAYSRRNRRHLVHSQNRDGWLRDFAVCTWEVRQKWAAA